MHPWLPELSRRITGITRRPTILGPRLIRDCPALMATSAWLRFAFSELHFEIIEVAASGDLTVAHATTTGRQTGPFVVFPQGGKPVSFPPTGRSFAVRQCHIFHRLDGRHADHAAVRDDLGMMTQLGHLPPSPKAMLRLARRKTPAGQLADRRREVGAAAEEACRFNPAERMSGPGYS